MKNPSPQNKPAIWWWAAVGASLLAAMLIGRWAGWDALDPGLWAGWTAAWVIMATGHWRLRAALQSAINGPSHFLAGFVLARLLILLILIFVVVMTGFLRTEPFVAGLLSAYFAGVWVEMAWLATRTSGIEENRIRE